MITSKDIRKGIYMKRITNKKLKKEFKKTNRLLIFSFIALIIGTICFVVKIYNEKNVPQNSKYLNELIESKDEKREDINTNLKIKLKPIKFATMANNKNKNLYITSDGSYYYIISPKFVTC